MGMAGPGAGWEHPARWWHRSSELVSPTRTTALPPPPSGHEARGHLAQPQPHDRPVNATSLQPVPSSAMDLGTSRDISSVLGTRGLTYILINSDHRRHSPLAWRQLVQRRLNLSRVRAGGGAWVVRPRLPPRSWAPLPRALFSKTGAGAGRAPAFSVAAPPPANVDKLPCCVLVCSVGGHGPVVTRSSWERGVKGPAVWEQDRRRGGDKREARLKKDPASWVSAPARKRTHLCPLVHPKRRAPVHSSARLVQGPRCLWGLTPHPAPGSDAPRGLPALCGACTCLPLSQPGLPNLGFRSFRCAPAAATLG